MTRRTRFHRGLLSFEQCESRHYLSAVAFVEHDIDVSRRVNQQRLHHLSMTELTEIACQNRTEY